MSLLSEPSVARDRLAYSVAGIVAFAICASSFLIDRSPPEEIYFPSKAVRSVPRPIRERHVFNDMIVGGYLIAQGIKPYIDSRLELYPKAMTADYFKIVSPDPDAMAATFAKWDVAWTIMPPFNKANLVLRSMPEWCKFYEDKVAVVYIRRDVLAETETMCPDAIEPPQTPP